jgi:hypothetical protein
MSRDAIARLADAIEIHSSRSIRSVYKLAAGSVCLVLAACSSTQLNSNTADLATSINSLTKKQIFYNLEQAFNDKQFVPSQITLVSGTATTSNSIQPTLSVPFLPSFQATNTYGSSNVFGTQANQTALAGPGLSLQVSDGWNQNWTMSPLTDANQIARLRALYNFVVAGAAQTAVDAVEISGVNKRRDFLCNYPLQSFAIALNVAAGNLGTSGTSGTPDGDGTKTKAVDTSRTRETILSSPIDVRKLAETAEAADVAANKATADEQTAKSTANLTGKPVDKAAAEKAAHARAAADAAAAAAKAAAARAAAIKAVQEADLNNGKAVIVAFDNGNAIIEMKCPAFDPKNSVPTDRIVYRYADPTFLVGPNCIICVDPASIGPAADKSSNNMVVEINEKLRPSFIFRETATGRSPIGSFSSLNGIATFYAEDQTGYSGSRAFSDFILLTYEAMTQTGTTGNGKTNGTGTYVLALPR